ncbi:MAG: biotin-dependent carboxyltransferase [Clostridia bacterium]|nr:biotin-dependent carboxyltransferase [Clostridia bacterium]
MMEILRPGLLTTVQDGGRMGYQAFGVPVCGAMDWLSLARANILAGNRWDEAAFEITGMGPAVQFHVDCVFALSGADFSTTLNGNSLPTDGACLAHEGDVLEMGAAKNGFRAYLAVSGGLDIPKVMESRSTCLAAGFGGFEGRALKKGDRVALRAPQLWLKDLPHRSLEPFYDPEAPVRVVLGPQDDVFTEEGIETFFTSEYRLGAQCDRMGCRLEGGAIDLKEGKNPNILSDGIVMGSIQVPNGQPIVMMADRQTTGGYVKLGTVITADLPLMAQKRPGDKVRFEKVTVQQAQAARLYRCRKLRNLQGELDRFDRW